MNKCVKCGNNRQYKVSNLCDNCIINEINHIEYNREIDKTEYKELIMTYNDKTLGESK